jgi:hypothetical protein
MKGLVTFAQQVKRANELLPSVVQSKNKQRLCSVCHLYIHKDVESCQPCIGAKPGYSMLHKFEPQLKFQAVENISLHLLRKEKKRLEAEISDLNQRLEECRRQINTEEVRRMGKRFAANTTKRAKCDCLTHNESVVAVGRDCPIHGW